MSALDAARGYKNNLAGQTFGRLVVRSFHGNETGGGAIWLCDSESGTEKPVPARHLRRGDVQSCGCLAADTLRKRSVTHGKSKTSQYKIWTSMIQRCTNPQNPEYPYYGDRGVTVCDRWLNSFEAFLEDMGPRPSARYSLDRFPNNDGNYEPGNVRWATDKEQGRNRRSNRLLTHDGLTLCVADWSDRTGIAESTITKRLKLGWDIGRTLSTAVATRWRKSGGAINA